MPRSISLLAALLALFMSVNAWGEVRLPAEMEDRARSLFLELRCVVCQNQSIGDSDADVAKDLREIVREQMMQGKTNQEIREFLVARYGEFILLKPVFAWHTAVLWIAPVILLLIGGLFAWRAGRSRRALSVDEKLTEQERAELQRIMDREAN